MAHLQPVRTPGHPAAPKARPDPRPMRMALSAGGVAALSALAAVIVLPPRQATVAVPQQPAQATDPQASPTSIEVVRPIQYVQLLPGETPPPGATVIQASAPTPITVVVTITAPPAPKVAAQTPTIIRTTQSGKVVP